MRLIVSLIICLVAIGPTAAVAAERKEALRLPRGKTEAQIAKSPRAKANPCAEYGPGFAPIDGTATCIKIGGSVGIGVGSSIGTGR